MNRLVFILLFFTLIACDRPADPSSVVDSVKDPVAAASAPVHRIVHLPDSGRMEGDEINGKREGPWASYFKSGGVWSRSTFVNGVEEGPTEVFHENGMTYYTGYYLHGTPFAEWTFFDLHGKELKRVMYDSMGVVVR